MPSDIQKRLKKLPPFEEDIPMIAEVKEIAKGQSKPSQIQEPKEEPEEETPQISADTPLPAPPAEVSPPQAQETTPPPPEVSERTAEQIEKLTTHNKQLKEENTALIEDKVEEIIKPNVMESLRPPEETPYRELTPQLVRQVDEVTPDLKQPQVEDVYAKLIDKDGYIDPDLLIKTLRDANESARQANIRAEQAGREAQEAKAETRKTKRDFEESKEVRLVHKKYPQINPHNEDFNENFWDDVRKEIATAPILKGTTPSFMEAADLVWNARYAPKEVEEEVKKKDKEKIEEAENAKKQINASAPTGRPSSYYAKSEDEALRQATIYGKKGALAERLRRIGQ